MYFVGQTRVKQQLELALSRSKKSHIALFSRPGQGKTRLARKIVKDLDAEMIYVNATAVKNSYFFLKEISKARRQPAIHHFIVIDESHNLPKAIKENLLSVLEEPATLCFSVPSKMAFPVETGGGRTIKTEFKKGEVVKAKLPKNMSFIFCTTSRSALSEALCSRMICIELEEYSLKEKIEISKQWLAQHATDLTIPENIIEQFADISRNVRDLLEHKLATFVVLVRKKCRNHAVIPDYKEWLDIMDISEDGLTSNDREYLDVVVEHGPVAVATIASLLAMPINDVKEKIEPFLLQKGLVQITKRGRVTEMEIDDSDGILLKD